MGDMDCGNEIQGQDLEFLYLNLEKNGNIKQVDRVGASNQNKREHAFKYNREEIVRLGGDTYYQNTRMTSNCY